MRNVQVECSPIIIIWNWSSSYFLNWSKLGPLPDFRVNFDFPYLPIGIDYADPVYFRNIYNNKDNDLYKALIVLITSSSRSHLHHQEERLGNQTFKKHHVWEVFSNELSGVPNDAYEKHLVMQK